MRISARGTRLAVLVVAALGLLEAGCLVQIEHVRDPRPAFERALAEAESLRGLPGPARELNVLVYDADDSKLVRVSLPMWMVRKLDHHASIRDFDFETGEERRVAAEVSRRIRVEDLERAGLGILVEVEEDGGERVLVWLR